MNQPWHPVYSNRARKSIKAIPAKIRSRIEQGIFGILTDPYSGKPLQGQFKGFYSLKIWPYRVVYMINKEKRILEVFDVGHRQGIYK